MNGAQEAAEAYFPDELALSIAPLGEGHIHESYALRAGLGEPFSRLVLQRINQSVFPDPQGLVRNAVRISQHLQARALATGRNAEKEVLRLVPAHDGRLSVTDSGGDVWRAFALIEHAEPISYPTAPSEAHAIGTAFGRFLLDMADFPANEIAVTLPKLHDGKDHLSALDQATRDDSHHRCASVAQELDLIDARRGAASAAFSDLPQRLIHADTKINNVLVDRDTGLGLCVIDLDTVMVGASVIDSGNFLRSVLRRSGCTEQATPEPGLSFFEAGLRGYRAGVGELLDEAEWAAVVDAIVTTAVTLAVRFLADYLAGDRYFRVSEPEDNLHRCREQLAVVAWVDANEAKLRGMSKRIARSDR